MNNVDIPHRGCDTFLIQYGTVDELDLLWLSCIRPDIQDADLLTTL